MAQKPSLEDAKYPLGSSLKDKPIRLTDPLAYTIRNLLLLTPLSERNTDRIKELITRKYTDVGAKSLEQQYKNFITYSAILTELANFREFIWKTPYLNQDETPYFIEVWERFLNEVALPQKPQEEQYKDIREKLELIVNVAFDRTKVFYDQIRLKSSEEFESLSCFSQPQTQSERQTRGKHARTETEELKKGEIAVKKVIIPYLKDEYKLTVRARYVRYIKIATAALAIAAGLILTATGIFAPIGIFLKLAAVKFMLHELAISVSKVGILIGNGAIDSSISAIPLFGLLEGGIRINAKFHPISVENEEEEEERPRPRAQKTLCYD